MHPPLEFLNVVKRYAQREILRGVGLTIGAGEIVGLVGINGAGKSTLLKAMLELIDIDEGTIKLNGVDHRDVRARCELAYLAENFAPPYYASGNDFLNFVARLHNVIPTAHAITEECTNLDLEVAALQRPVSEYSKGMTQKIGLIGCLLTARSLLVLDEPMSGLDPRSRALFKARITRFRETGGTIFFSTHLLDDVARLCDRIAILDAGRIRFSDTTEMLQETFPGDGLEASFLKCIEAAAAQRFDLN